MEQAHDFNLADQNGIFHTLNEYKGKWLVLYFYPKDDTSGCTTEACNFRDAREVIAELGGAEVVGVSQDSVESHKSFVDKYQLNFTLLSDPEHGVIDAYDSWKSKNYNGKEFMGIPKSYIVKKYMNADPQTHTGDIIKDLKALQAAST
jgi:thioredoxin-dependent peroxiredoxin